MEVKGFQSIFKINNVPIMPPVIDHELRQEIIHIRELVRAKELKLQKLKEEKDSRNLAKQLEEDEADRISAMGPRRLSYVLTDGQNIFDSTVLPKISVDSSESDKNTVIDGSLQSVLTDFDENANDKSSKDLKNEIDKMSITSASSVYQEVIEPQVNLKLKDLIEKQKQEYLAAMDQLKHKFTSEQHELLTNFHSNFVTSTPLNSSALYNSVEETSDDEFTAFKTALQSQSLNAEEKTLVNDEDAKIKAAIVLQSACRGFLVRRLLRTVYVQDHIRNIKETLHLVLGLDDHAVGGSPVQNILLKAKLFRQLQTDLYNFNAIFTNSTTAEKMKIISSDREVKLKKQVEENQANLSLSFRDVV